MFCCDLTWIIKDMFVKLVFSLMKEVFDKDIFFRETGKLAS